MKEFDDGLVPDDWVPVTLGATLPEDVVALLCTSAGTLQAKTVGSGNTVRNLGTFTAETIIPGRFKVVDAASTGTFLAGVVL